VTPIISLWAWLSHKSSKIKPSTSKNETQKDNLCKIQKKTKEKLKMAPKKEIIKTK
jgi:hypothetical protein